MKKTITTYFKSSFLFFLFFFVSINTYATHHVGAEISYRCLGNNQYKIELTSYTYCPSNALSTLFVDLQSATCTNFTATLVLENGYPLEITPVCPSTTTTCNGGGILGTNRVLYTGIVTLGSCSDWVVSKTFGTRVEDAVNIDGLGSNNNIYVRTLIDPTMISCNDSPHFIEENPLYIGCTNDTILLNYMAVDDDGDSLVYSLVNSLSNNGYSANYISPYTGQNPIAGSISINSSTGILKIFTNIQQFSVIAVKVEEYRNGVKIGEITRDFPIWLKNCNNTIPKVTAINGNNVSGNTFNITIPANIPFNLYSTISDPEVSAGLQSFHANWQNTPANFVGNTLGNIQWTPANAQIGTHHIIMRLEDDACPILGVNYYLYKITVIANTSSNFPPSAIHDYYNVPFDNVLTANALSNDFDLDGDNIHLNNYLVYGSSYGAHTSNSIDSTFTYTPAYPGVQDYFIYEICDDGSPFFCSQATVYINVGFSNTLGDTIVAGTTTNLCLNTTGLVNVSSITQTTDNLNNATIVNIDTTNACLEIRGDSLSTDIIYFQLCDSLGNCITRFIQLTVEQGVWAGDTDVSQVVDNFDLLNLGLGYGTTGTPRANPSIVWNGYRSDDWINQTPVSQINYKHLDCNGDGIINIQDTVAISSNWNLSYTYNKSGAGIIPLYVDTISNLIKKPTLPIMLGTSSIPASDIYGIAFTISYDTSLIRPNTIDIGIDTSWLGSAWTDLIKVHKDFYNDGMVQVAITRTDGIDFDGFGRIGSLSFTIQDDIMQRGVLKFPFEISNVKAIDQNEMEILINPLKTEISVIATNTKQLHLAQFVNVFPNPVNDILNIQTEDLIIEQVTLSNIAGQIIETKTVNNYQTELYMQNLPNGIYTLSIMTNKGLVHKKVNVLK